LPRGAAPLLGRPDGRGGHDPRCGFELFREIRLPLDGLDVQLFAESLVSIAHLVYRYEPYTPPESPAAQRL